jgi:hypothetical protein
MRKGSELSELLDGRAVYKWSERDRQQIQMITK